jgi:Tfp pilus assembly protein PilO
VSGAVLLRIAREKRLIVAPLAIAIVLNLALAVGLVLPLSRRVDTDAVRSAQAQAALKRAAHERASAAGTLEHKRRADQDLSTLYTSVLPSNLSQARRQTYLRLSRLAADAELRTQRRMEELQESKSSLARLEITMELRGDYEGIRQFLHDIETSAEFITIDHVSVGEGPEPGSPLVLNVVLATYFKAGQP